jgi:hypothetical protein
VAAEKSQTPLTHRSCVQTLLSLHAVHAAPFLPHALALSLPSAMQTPLLTQPVQHAPLMQSPPVQGVWLVTLTWVHEPLGQPSVVHGLPSSQL